MQVLVKNNLRIRGLVTASRVKLAILDALTMPNPEYDERKKKRRGTWGIEPKLQLYAMDNGDIVTGRGFLPELLKIMRENMPWNQLPIVEEQYNDGLPADFGEWTGWPLRDYQRGAVAAIYDSNGVLESPAGSGKTLMGMNYVLLKGRCTVWLTHTADLMKQARDNAVKYMGNVGTVGMIGDGKLEWGSGKLIVCMAQTLKENPQLIETLDKITGTLVIDEAHHFPAPLFMEVANKFSAKNFIGLTATPDRKDGLERFMYVGIGPKQYAVPRTVLHQAGQLIIPEVRFVYTEFQNDPASVVSEIGAVDAGGEDLDYAALVDDVIHDTGRLELVARNIVANAPGNYSLVLTESVRYCYYIRDALLDICRRKGVPPPHIGVVHGSIAQYTWRAVAGIHTAMQRVQQDDAVAWRISPGSRVLKKGDEYYSQDEVLAAQREGFRPSVRIQQYSDKEIAAWKCTPTQRAERIQAMRDKQLDILIATQLAREGLDIPHLNIEHMTMSKRGDTGTNRKDGSAVEQEAGRIQRPDPTNSDKQAILFDYVDYHVGVFRDQYYSRRKVYTRLGFKVPKKPRTVTDDIDAFLGMYQ